MFELKLRSKLFSIPSNFRFINDINNDIYTTLLTKKQYEVKSNVSEDVFQSFINYWVNRETPIFYKNNINEYERLSKEFDLMHNIIQLYKNATFYNFFWKNQKIKMQIMQSNDILTEKMANYYHIINALINNDVINLQPDIKIELFDSLITDNINSFDLLTQQKPIVIDDLLFILNEQEKTAGLFRSLTSKSELELPRSINYQNDEYLVTYILDDSFKNFQNIKSITFLLPSELRSIGKYAFSNSSLENITIPSTVTEICEEAFSFCRNLINLRFENDSQLNLISKKAFSSSSLQCIEIPQNVEIIEESAFFGCSQLIDVSFLDDSNLKSIGEYSFSQTSINYLILPPKLTKIASYTFSNCYNLKTINFTYNSQLKSIQKYAFINSSISVLSLPKKLEKLEDGWAAGTPNLTKIQMMKESNAFEQNYAYYYDKYIFGKSGKSEFFYDVLEFARRDIEIAEIPSFIKYISPFAFDECKNLKSVEFSPTSGLLSIGKYAFSNSSISKMSIPSSVIELRKSFSSSDRLNEILVLPLNCHFSYLNSSVLLGKSSKDSEKYDSLIFARRDIEKVVVPSFIKRIEAFAFYSCSKLRSIEFSGESELEYIGKDAFAKSSIEKLSIPSHVVKIGKSCFCECNRLTCLKFNECSELLSIKNKAFDQTKIESFSIPSHVAEISQLAFYNCCYLKIIEVPENSHLFSLDFSYLNISKIILMVPPNISQSLLYDNSF